MTEAMSWSLLAAAMDQVHNAVVITDADFSAGGPHVVFCNPAFLALTGYHRDEIVGLNLRVLQGPETDPKVIAHLRECLRLGEYFEGQTVNYRKDGTPYTVQWSISPVRDAQGTIVNYVSVQQDVSARLLAEADRDMLAEALAVVAEPVMVTDASHHLVYVNHAFEQVTGYRGDEVLGRAPRFLYEGGGEEQTYETIVARLDQGLEVREHVTLRAKDGHLMHNVHNVKPSRFSTDRAVRNVSSFTDVTDLVHVADSLREQASTDPLTGLRNRRSGEAVLQARMREFQQAGRTLSVAICDIDHFKRINDTFGHGTGDEVIVDVAWTLSTSVRDQDVAVRWGGEEFLLILVGTSIDGAVQIAERVRAGVQAVERPEVGEVTISIGVAQALDGDNVETVLSRADGALYEAKRAGRNRVHRA